MIELIIYFVLGAVSGILFDVGPRQMKAFFWSILKIVALYEKNFVQKGLITKSEKALQAGRELLEIRDKVILERDQMILEQDQMIAELIQANSGIEKTLSLLSLPSGTPLISREKAVELAGLRKQEADSMLYELKKNFYSPDPVQDKDELSQEEVDEMIRKLEVTLANHVDTVDYSEPPENIKERLEEIFPLNLEPFKEGWVMDPLKQLQPDAEQVTMHEDVVKPRTVLTKTGGYPDDRLICSCGNFVEDDDIDFNMERENDEGETYYMSTVFCEACGYEPQMTDFCEWKDVESVKKDFIEKGYFKPIE